LASQGLPGEGSSHIMSGDSTLLRGTLPEDSTRQYVRVSASGSVSACGGRGPLHGDLGLASFGTRGSRRAGAPSARAPQLAVLHWRGRDTDSSRLEGWARLISPWSWSWSWSWSKSLWRSKRSSRSSRSIRKAMGSIVERRSAWKVRTRCDSVDKGQSSPHRSSWHLRPSVGAPDQAEGQH